MMSGTIRRTRYYEIVFHKPFLNPEFTPSHCQSLSPSPQITILFIASIPPSPIISYVFWLCYKSQIAALITYINAQTADNAQARYIMDLQYTKHILKTYPKMPQS